MSSLIKQYSRISHHTLTTTGTTNFTVPPSEDFTDGSWTITDLAKSEFGVAEGTDRLFIRIDDGIFQIPLSTATGATLAELWSGGTGSNVVFVNGNKAIDTSGDYAIIGGEYNSAAKKRGIVIGRYNVLDANDSAILGGQFITGTTDNTVYVPYLNLNYTPNSGTTEDNILVRDSSTGEVKETPNIYNYGLFVQTGDSATVSATTTETSIISSGKGTLTVPANTFKNGDSFHAKIGGLISATNNAELTIRLKSGTGNTLTTIGPIILPSMTNQFWEMEADFTLRKTGVATASSLQTNGQFVFIENSGNNYNGYGFNTNTKALDTTVDNTLDITIEWDTNNASNSIMSDLFYLKKVY